MRIRASFLFMFLFMLACGSAIAAESNGDIAKRLILEATDGVKGPNGDFTIPPLPGLKKMSAAESGAFVQIVEAVQIKDRKAFNVWQVEKRDGNGPLPIVEFHTLLRVLSTHLIDLRFHANTADLCADKLVPPRDVSWDENHGKIFYDHWWQVAAKQVKPEVCKKVAAEK